MAVEILNHQNEAIGTLPEDLARTLATSPLSDASLAYLDQLHRERQRLRCTCGRILHAVQREYVFLRRNPKQEPVNRECPLCESATKPPHARVWVRQQPPVGISLILGTRIHPKPSRERDEDEDEKERKTNSQKYQRAFGVLFQVMKRAKFTSLQQPLHWTEMWQRLRDVLAAVKPHDVARATLAEFAWTPGGVYRGGLRDLNQRMLNLWDHPELKAECWTFGVTELPPTAGRLDLWQTDPEIRRRAEERQPPPLYPPYQLEVSPSSVATIGRTGPYLVFAIGSANAEEDQQFAKPRYHRLLLQAIAGEHCPVPVESDHEREMVRTLQRMRIRFYKPVFDSPEGLRPDFVLLDHKVIVEVQGFSTDDYREHKREVHERLRASETFGGHELILYSPNDGETVAEFAVKLRRLLARAH